MTSAILVAAGSSRRMGFDKLFAELAGKPVLARSIDAFQKHPEIDEIIVVTAEANWDQIRSWNPDAKLVEGGTARHFSVANGLEAVSPDCELVAIHDGARPLIHTESIADCLLEAREKGAASCARRITETLKRADADCRVTKSVDRDQLWAMETPQCFQLELIRRSYQHVLDSDKIVTDEVSAVEALGESVYLVENPHPNLKVTFPSDLELAGRLLDA
ncbi:MAG: 2-C-methyl-D-erythritol 4-phosphate cytidylyltransferase [Verrucomicrobiota bacterium]